MDSADVERMVGLVRHVQAAWDQYTIQQRLPEDGGWLTQGHPWSAYNRGPRFVPARRDPLAMSAAWNDLEEGLRELSVVADRLRDRRTPAAAELVGAGWHDQRVGPYSPAPQPLAAAGAMQEVGSRPAAA